jgi:hypothetical protein
MDLEEMGWQVVNWNNVTWDRDQWPAPVNIIMNLKVPQNAGNVLSS